MVGKSLKTNSVIFIQPKYEENSNPLSASTSSSSASTSRPLNNTISDVEQGHNRRESKIDLKKTIFTSSLSTEGREKFQQRMLNVNFPINLTILHFCLLVAISIAAIVIQALMILNNIPSNDVGTGIWVGSYFLTAAALTVLLS